MQVLTAHNFTRFETSSVEVKPEGVKLPDQPASWVLLSNWNVDNDSDLNLKTPAGLAYQEALLEVFWGYNGHYGHQLFTSETSNVWIPCTNLKQISLRCRSLQKVFVWYSFVY